MNRKSIRIRHNKWTRVPFDRQQCLTLVWKEVDAITPPVLYHHCSFYNYITMKQLFCSSAEQLLLFVTIVDL